MRQCRVFRLEIEYPPGSDAPGWVPDIWPEFLAGMRDRARRRELRERGFRWPRERMFLSSSSAYARAGLLIWFGATVYVEASSPVTWPEWQDTSANGKGWEEGSTAMRWRPPEKEPAPFALSAADVREAMAGIYAEGEWRE
jgi:hypothetical protein